MLDCALEGSRLCQLTMANKHLHGIDGIPVDQEQAYGKFHLLFLQGKLSQNKKAFQSKAI